MVFAAQGRLQLVPNDLHHLLGGCERAHDLVGEGTPADSVEEVVDHVQRHVGLEERRAHVGKGPVHLFRVELAPGPELAEDGVETAGERVEHGMCLDRARVC